MNDLEIKNSLGRQVGDSISNLPDQLIHHILSFLPTKYVLQTSILSRRWQYLWTSVSHLDFDYKLFHIDWGNYEESCIKFKKFVDMVLALHDSNVEKFRLVCIECDTSCIGIWILGAIRRMVREVQLDTGSQNPLELPHCLFNYTSLVVLRVKLRGSVLVVPKSIHLPKLKILHFRCIQFTGNNLSRSLFAYFPSLEDLVLKYCEWGLIDSFIISAPTLACLYISAYSWMVYEPGSVKCRVKISAPNLKSLTCSGLIAHDYSLADISSLLNGFLDLRPNPLRDMDYDRSASNILNVAHTVKILHLTDNAIRLLFSAQYVSDRLPIFYNLKQLRVEASRFRGHLHVICRLLCHSPVLESLSICIYGVEAEQQESEKLPLNCVCNCLKVVRFERGYKSQLELMKWILGNAIVLERMSIKREGVVKDQMLLKQELSMYPKVSKNGVIELII